MPESPSIAIILEDNPQLSAPLLKELYGITGRSTVELTAAVTAGGDVYAAELFGNDHFDVAPRLEKVVRLCDREHLRYRIEETYEGEPTRIDASTMRNILEAASDLG